MAYTAEQQKRLDDALARLTSAKSTYQGWVASYNDWVASIQGCYKDHMPDAAAGSTWFNAFATGPCTTKGSCKQSDVANCKAVIEKTLNATTLPQLKATYNELVAAQANYDKVVSEVATESKNDPANVLAQHQADASAAAQAASSKLKWIFAIVVVVVAAIAFFAYKKFFKS